MRNSIGAVSEPLGGAGGGGRGRRASGRAAWEGATYRWKAAVSKLNEYKKRGEGLGSTAAAMGCVNSVRVMATDSGVSDVRSSFVLFPLLLCSMS